MKHAIITAFLGKLRDRFCEYNTHLTLIEKLELMATIPGLDGAEIVYPYELEGTSVEEVKAALRRTGLGVAAVNVNIKPDPDFHTGALSSHDSRVRQKAVDFIKGGKDFAAQVGATQVTCAPLNDGYDYSFHTHYVKAWQRMVESVKEAAAYRSEITLFLEYKPNEPRVRCLLDSCAKTIVLCDDVGSPDVGITVDIGHALYGGETPAESLAHASMSGFPFYVQISDNDTKWDWDVMVGTYNTLKYVEFLFWCRELGYDGWLTTDAAPVRQDRVEFFSYNVRMTRQILEWLDVVDRDFIREHLERHEFLPILKSFEGSMFNPASVRDRAAAR